MRRGGGGEDSHCVTPYTLQIVTSTGQRSTTDEKSEIFAYAVSVFVCDGEEGWDKSAKYLHRYISSFKNLKFQDFNMDCALSIFWRFGEETRYVSYKGRRWRGHRHPRILL